MLFGDALRTLSIGSLSPRTYLPCILGWTFAIAVPCDRDCLHGLRVGVKDERSWPTLNDINWKLSLLMMDGT